MGTVQPVSVIGPRTGGDVPKIAILLWYPLSESSLVPRGEERRIRARKIRATTSVWIHVGMDKIMRVVHRNQLEVQKTHQAARMNPSAELTYSSLLFKYQSLAFSHIPFSPPPTSSGRHG